MDNIVLLAVAAAWVAVLIPPLLRSRMENRPNSSVTDFRRQLSTLQRSVPTRHVAPMRSMGRSLAPSTFPRPNVVARPTQPHRTLTSHAAHLDDRRTSHSAVLERRDVRSVHHGSGRPRYAIRVSERELTRRRRVNVLISLVIAVVLSAFLAASTQSSAMMYLFLLAAVSLCGYCYQLVRLRQREFDRQYADSSWSHAA